MPSQRDVMRLLLQNRSMLLAFIRARVPAFDMAEDVFQEVALAVQEDWSAFAEGTSFGAWSREIARRRILAGVRAGRLKELPLGEEVFTRIERSMAARESPDLWASHKEALRECLDKVGAEGRQLIDLRYEHGLACGEIARRLNRSAPAVHMGLSRTRALLFDCVSRRLAAQEVTK